jgi:hypothetical protein
MGGGSGRGLVKYVKIKIAEDTDLRRKEIHLT